MCISAYLAAGRALGMGEAREFALRSVDRLLAEAWDAVKAIRAEPISALYEQNRVHHVGAFPILEDQLCDWDPAVSTNSPDRLDALVWALTELAGDPAGPIKIATGLLARMRR